MKKILFFYVLLSFCFGTVQGNTLVQRILSNHLESHDWKNRYHKLSSTQRTALEHYIEERKAETLAQFFLDALEHAESDPTWQPSTPVIGRSGQGVLTISDNDGIYVFDSRTLEMVQHLKKAS